MSTLSAGFREAAKQKLATSMIIGQLDRSFFSFHQQAIYLCVLPRRECYQYHFQCLSRKILIVRLIVCQRVNTLQHTVEVQQTITVAKDIVSCKLYVAPGNR